MNNGDLITVSGRAGTVPAVVVDVRAVDDLPDLAELPIARWQDARAWIAARCFRRIALVAYDLRSDDGACTPVVFIAFEDRAGLWWDLHGHNLQLDPRREEETPCPARSTDTQRPN